MPILLCAQDGLIKGPELSWKFIGRAEGTTTKEVADNFAKKDVTFAKFYNPIEITFCKWALDIAIENDKIKNDKIKIVRFNALLDYQYYINDKYIRKIDLIEKLAKFANIEIINEGNGTKEER